jgi:hypothetical protein
VGRVDSGVVADVEPLVSARALEEGQEPQDCHPEVGQPRKLGLDAVESVAEGVGVGAIDQTLGGEGVDAARRKGPALGFEVLQQLAKDHHLVSIQLFPQRANPSLIPSLISRFVHGNLPNLTKKESLTNRKTGLIVLKSDL